MSGHPPLKKPKTEPQEAEQELDQEEDDDKEMEEQIRREQEVAMMALIDHRSQEVDHLRQRITYYKAQLDDAEKKLEVTQNKLAHHRGQTILKASKSVTNGRKDGKVKRCKGPSKISKSSQEQYQHQDNVDIKPSGDRPSSPLYKNGVSSPNQTQSKPQILIPSVAPNISQHINSKDSATKYSSGSGDNLNVTRRPSIPLYKNGVSSPNQTQSKPQILIPSVAPNISQHINAKDSANKYSSGSGDNLNVTRKPSSPLYKNGVSSPNQTQSRPQILIPSVAPNISQHINAKDSATKYSSGSGDNLNFTRRPSSPLYKNGVSSPNQTQSRPQILIPSVAPNISQHINAKDSATKYSSGSGDNLNFTRRPSSPLYKNGVSSPNQTQSKPQILIPSVAPNISPHINAKDYANKYSSGSGDNLNVTRRPSSPLYKNGVSSSNQTQSRPQILIPSVAPNISQHIKAKDSANKFSSGSGSLPTLPTPAFVNPPAKSKASNVSSELESVETQSNRTKRKFEETKHRDLIKMINKTPSPAIVRCQTEGVLHSQHKRTLRSLVLCPTNDQLFCTSALDGVVNLWQVQGRGSSVSLVSSNDCLSKHRRWPEDIAWHPHGKKLFSVYSADNGESQISVLNLNKGKERTHVRFLKDKPHTKGIINSIEFMPWDDKLFVTGGSDHAVILWCENKDMKPITLHRSYHSSAVTGIAGMKQKNLVMSAGADKKIVGCDVNTGRVEYKHHIDSKCMSVLPNPCDFNLFMVQTGTPKLQLRLFDIRSKRTEIHAFGWKQEMREAQSALISQAWSPDGLYITSGSADPIIHMFDIRHNARTPSQSIRAHHKRVFKAAWHHALPLLISISSDLNIGLHRII